MKCYDICTFFCPYYIICITICLSLKFLGHSVTISSKPNENVFDMCHNIWVKSSYYHSRKISRMTIILFIFMSDVYFFCVCLMRDVLLLLSTILYDLWIKLYEYLMRRCEQAYQKAWPPVNIKTAIFNLQHLSHFCMNFNVTNMSRSAIIQLF